MLEITKYAAIDIGSNAVRLLISNVIKQENKPIVFKKNALIRVPIRLGGDVFIDGRISDTNRQRMKDTMTAFYLLMKSHGVVKYKACATSAMRDAKNGVALCAEILDECGIKIDIINGEEEAKIIAATGFHSFIDPNKTYLYVDVGGGSTELSVIHNSKKIASKSFKIGTVRLLHNNVSDATWKAKQEWIEAHTEAFDKIQLIGTGGNINKIFKVSGKEMGKPLSYFYLISYYNTLQNYSYDERITELNLNQDRADVILPALRIYISAMKWCGAKDVLVPKIGLSDGIIKSMYHEAITAMNVSADS